MHTVSEWKLYWPMTVLADLEPHMVRWISFCKSGVGQIEIVIVHHGSQYSDTVKYVSVDQARDWWDIYIKEGFKKMA